MNSFLKLPVQSAQAMNTSIDGLKQLPETINLSIITQFYPPDFAATGQFVEELATQLAQQIQVQVFTGQPGYAYEATEAPRTERKQGVEVRRSRITHLRKRLGRTVSSLLFCVRAALHLCDRRHRGNLVLFVSEPPYLQTLGYIANLLFNLTYACLVYDLYPDVAVELGVVSERHWLVQFWNAVNQRVWRRAASIIVPSETMKQRIVNRVPDLAAKITVIHNWADPTWIKPLAKQENAFAQSHDLVDRFTVLYSGNMGRCHDMNTILGAARELDGEPVQFVFIGGGPKREECMRQVREWGLGNCQFLPYQEKTLLPQSLTACDLSLVSVDVGMEGLVAPSKFYSALSSGRPVAVICEPHSYLRQLVSTANCGAAFNNGDSKGLAGFIRYLMKDSQMKSQMGYAGHRYIASNFTPELISQQYLKVLQRVVLRDADLRRAVEQQEFCIHYQPIVSLTTGGLRGFEALVRWQHPGRGLVLPGEFLPALQENQLIIPMGWWLLNEACRQLHYWQAEFLHWKPLRLRVNLSVEQFLQPDLIPQLDRLMDSNELDGQNLILDVSEAVLMKDAAAATAVLLQLQTRQIQVCLDNFGTGYASLNLLHRFSISALTLDRTLISRMEQEPDALKLVKTITTLAHDLGIRVGATGIETAEQFQTLKAIGVQQGQGYYFSNPLDLDDARNFLMQHQPSGTFVAPAPLVMADETTTVTPLVLIVDDERMMRTLLRRTIEKEGYRVVEAENGKQAIDLYQSLQPDLVCLDAMMPEMDGFECCTHLRQIPASQVALASQTLLEHVPVLMITTLDDVESVDRAFAAGATDFITKPVNWAILRQRLHRLLQRSPR